MRIRVLVVDDSPLMRRLISDMIQSQPDMEVVGSAADGDAAVIQAAALKPDVMTLDVEMPKRTGLSALGQIMASTPVPVIMVSTLTSHGAKETIEALHLGAIDFVTKPSASPIGMHRIKDELLEKIRATRFVRLPGKPAVIAPTRAAATTKGADRVVVVASSTGGPRALTNLFDALPKAFPAAMLIVQHMPPGFTKSFAARLNACGTVPCKEAAAGDRVTPGMALLAPGGKHMAVGAGGEILLNEDPPLHGVRPAADVMFMTAAKAYGARCIGAVLTGMGKDGAEGAVRLRHAGAVVFGESEASCTIYGMPRAALQAGGIDAEYSINELAHAIVASLAGGRHARAS
jgi:two-component system chemotaxis response regulator CheB